MTGEFGQDEGPCICGHDPRDHRRLDPLSVTADWYDPDAPPQVAGMMRSFCGVQTGWSRWDRCECVLYTPTALLARQAALSGSSPTP